MACAVCVAHLVCNTKVGTKQCKDTINRMKEGVEEFRKFRIAGLLQTLDTLKLMGDITVPISHVEQWLKEL